MCIFTFLLSVFIIIGMPAFYAMMYYKYAWKMQSRSRYGYYDGEEFSSLYAACFILNILLIMVLAHVL